jgi:hypothetical protein
MEGVADDFPLRATLCKSGWPNNSEYWTYTAPPDVVAALVRNLTFASVTLEENKDTAAAVVLVCFFFTGLVNGSHPSGFAFFLVRFHVQRSWGFVNWFRCAGLACKIADVFA